MRLSLKIREAKKKLESTLGSNNPIHFANKEEYRDFILNQMIYVIHGSCKKETQLIIYYEYKQRFGEEVEQYFTYA
jgi:hypothetical protein